MKKSTKEPKLQFHTEAESKNKTKSFFKSIAYAFIPFGIYVFAWLFSWGFNQWFGPTTGIQPWIALDKIIPCIPQFVYVYYLTFPLGIITYFYLAKVDKSKLIDMTIIFVLCYIISGLFYYFMQTEFPFAVKETFISDPKTLSEKLTVLTWHASHPTNCLPSQHCFMAIGIVLCVAGTKDIKTWYKWLCYVMGVLIVLSTVFIKQHFVLDFVASFLIMLVLYLVVRLISPGKRIVRKIWGDEQQNENVVKPNETENKK